MSDNKITASSTSPFDNKVHIWANVGFKEDTEKLTKSIKSMPLKIGFPLKAKSYGLKYHLRSEAESKSTLREGKLYPLPRKSLPQTSILLRSKKLSKKKASVDINDEWINSQSILFSERRKTLRSQLEPSKEEAGNYVYYLPNDIKIQVSFQLRKLLAFIEMNNPDCKIIRDYYRNSVDEVYDDAFRYLYCSYKDSPVTKIEEIPEDSDIFIISPKEKLNFNPTLTGYDPEAQIIINASLLNPKLEGTINILPTNDKKVHEKQESPIKERDERKSTDGSIIPNKICCNLIEILPVSKRSRSTQIFRWKSDMPSTMPLFNNLEEAKAINWKAFFQGMKLSMPKTSRKSIPNNETNFEIKPEKPANYTERPLNGYKIKEGTGGFRKSFLPSLKFEINKLRTQNLQIPAQPEFKESPSKLPNMKDVVKEVQSVDAAFKNYLTRSEMITIATEYCSLQLKCGDSHGLDPYLVCLKYSVPFGVLKGINETLLSGNKMTWKEFSLFYILLVLERAELYNIVVFLFKYLDITKKEDIKFDTMADALESLFENKSCPDYAKKQWNLICSAVIAHKSAIVQRPGHSDIDLDDIVNIIAETKISVIDLRLFLSIITKGLLK
ncbi:unnamed protein product [Blepharisma stoltei]|uniref:Uncharacterized protein n=1 Tax=Blepharisma stoltei TaxID=1481888 RepID=A0AAU9I8W8_9CILI|nr:unnamed protein product [Blepharisma stoltei]